MNIQAAIGNLKGLLTSLHRAASNTIISGILLQRYG
jgi:hypothetical protein